MKLSLVFLLLAWTPALFFGLSDLHVDKAVVSVQNRPGHDWLFLDSAVSGHTSTTVDELVSTITQFDKYPELLPRIREVKVEEIPGATLITSKVVIAAIGIVDINIYTLKYVFTEVSKEPQVIRIDWTQTWTDGSIDSMTGGWLLEDEGTAEHPSVHVSYWTQSAIPSYAIGEKEFIQLFIGSETKNWVDLVVKKAAAPATGEPTPSPVPQTR